MNRPTRRTAQFACPACQSEMSVLVEAEGFCCAGCCRRYVILTTGLGEPGWALSNGGPAWSSQAVYPFQDVRSRPATCQPAPLPEPRLGAARRRQMRRRQGEGRPSGLRWLAGTALLLGLVLLSVPAFARSERAGLPGEKAAASGQAGFSEASVPTRTLPPAPTRTLLPPHTPVPATATQTPTQTATPTRVSSRRATATAWQAVIDRAAATSYAIQTENAVDYAATQTALPGVVSALKTQMAARATPTP